MQTVAIIHHLSSSGGTVISQCIAAQPSVVLLSEIHPHVGMTSPRFLPIDPLSHFLAGYPELRFDDATLDQLFRDRLEPVVKKCAESGKLLVLRDHSHSDYLGYLKPRPRLALALEGQYDLRRFVTLRNPIDAWLSMKDSHFDGHLTGFTDYCNKVGKFLEDHDHLPLWRYEDFVEQPRMVIGQICAHLRIPFNESFEQTFRGKRLTGDSGRKPEKITPLPRRPIPPQFLEEVSNCTSFATIAKRFNYAIPALVI